MIIRTCICENNENISEQYTIFCSVEDLIGLRELVLGFRELSLWHFNFCKLKFHTQHENLICIQKYLSAPEIAIRK